jgi:hypothetical protein
MESIDNDNGAPVLSNGGLLLPAKHIPMPAHDSAIALEKNSKVEAQLEREREIDRKIMERLLAENRADREAEDEERQRVQDEQRIEEEEWEAGREERERLAAEKQRIEEEEWEAGREERERLAAEKQWIEEDERWQRKCEEDKERQAKAMKRLGLIPISARAMKDQSLQKRPKMFGGTLERIDNCVSIANPGQEPSAINPNCGEACVTSSCAGTICVNY